MFLHLLRHAEAADLSPDSERPLTAKGRNDALALGKTLARQGIDLPQAIWCSPYRRARETAEGLLKGASAKATIQVRAGLTPCDEPADLLAELSEVEEDLLIVGHNPHLSILAGYLLGGPAAHVNVHYRKATLMRFEAHQIPLQRARPRLGAPLDAHAEAVSREFA